MVASRTYGSSPTALPLRELLEIDLTGLAAGDVQAIEIRAGYAFMRLSCREITSASQKRRMTQWQTLKTRCSADIRRRDRETIFSRQASYRRNAESDADIALAWHRRFFDHLTRGR